MNPNPFQAKSRLTRRNVLKALAAIGITGPLAIDLAAQTRTLVSGRGRW